VLSICGIDAVRATSSHRRLSSSGRQQDQLLSKCWQKDPIALYLSHSLSGQPFLVGSCCCCLVSFHVEHVVDMKEMNRKFCGVDSLRSAFHSIKHSCRDFAGRNAHRRRPRPYFKEGRNGLTLIGWWRWCWQILSHLATPFYRTLLALTAVV
jgi:hypothetical protein